MGRFAATFLAISSFLPSTGSADTPHGGRNEVVSVDMPLIIDQERFRVEAEYAPLPFAGLGLSLTINPPLGFIVNGNPVALFFTDPGLLELDGTIRLYPFGRGPQGMFFGARGGVTFSDSDQDVELGDSRFFYGGAFGYTFFVGEAGMLSLGITLDRAPTTRRVAAFHLGGDLYLAPRLQFGIYL